MRICSLISFALVVSLSVMLVGCIKKKPQSHWESNAADFVRQSLGLYEIENPGVARTNVGQIITNVGNREYPGDLHREFLAYGKHAGFTNSFFEKYIVVPESVTNRFPIAGTKAVLMNAEAFPGGDNHLYRMVIHESPGAGVGIYSYKQIPEQVIQRVFKEAGVPIPEPPRFPPPPRIPPPPAVPFSQKRFEYFRDLAVQLGLNSYHGPVLQNVVEGVAAISLALVCFLGFRAISRRSRKRSDH